MVEALEKAGSQPENQEEEKKEEEKKPVLILGI
jgi:hypothetical protein